jgi:CRISPR/Cas system-associated exonuclease Cas4 (RecB family)
MSIYVLAPFPLKPLLRISPSRYSALRSCALKEIWASDRQPPLLPASPAAHLGVIAHKLLEMAFAGRLADEGAMQACWEKEMQQYEYEMRNNPLEQHLIPLASHASNYRVKQIMAYNMVRPLLREVGQGAKTGKSAVELWVQTEDGKIGGKIDMVKHTNEGISIIDYKTGMITDPHQDGDIKDDYKIQIKMYAALYFISHGNWPDKLILMGLNQYEYSIPFDREECLVLLKSAIDYFDDLNSRIEAGLDADAFATPIPETCKYCVYRPACKSYWTIRGQNGWPSDFEGVIEEKQVLGNGFFKVKLDNEGEIAVVRGLSPDRHVFLNSVSGKAMFCNLGKDAVQGYYKEIPMTTSYGFNEK